MVPKCSILARPGQNGTAGRRSFRSCDHRVRGLLPTTALGPADQRGPLSLRNVAVVGPERFLVHSAPPFSRERDPSAALRRATSRVSSVSAASRTCLPSLAHPTRARAAARSLLFAVHPGRLSAIRRKSAPVTTTLTLVTNQHHRTSTAQSGAYWFWLIPAATPRAILKCRVDVRNWLCSSEFTTPARPAGTRTRRMAFSGSPGTIFENLLPPSIHTSRRWPSLYLRRNPTKSDKIRHFSQFMTSANRPQLELIPAQIPSSASQSGTGVRYSFAGNPTNSDKNTMPGAPATREGWKWPAVLCIQPCVQGSRPAVTQNH